jgi:hypothetical protein
MEKRAIASKAYSVSFLVHQNLLDVRLFNPTW